jgi:predicted Zn-dependent peptidase
MAEMLTLANGIRLFVDPMAGLETAAIGVWAKAGAIDEREEESGVAHLLEHMAFKGTRRRTARQIAEEIEAVGGYLNAATSYQRTGYYARILKGDIDLAIDILADILTEPLFDEVELNKEKEVVVQEIGEAWDSPDDAVHELLQGVAFRGQSLGRPILGTVNSVRSHDRARLRSFMDRLYCTDNMIVAAAGAVDADHIARAVEARFPKSAAPAANHKRPSPLYRGGVAYDERDIEQTHIAVSYPGVSVRHEDFYATRVFSEMLGGGMASRLFQTIREERGLAYSVYSYADCYEEVGVLGVYVGADEANAKTAAELIRAEIGAMAEAVTQTELDRACAMLKSTLLMGLESPTGRTEAAAGQIASFGRPIPAAEIRERLDAVSMDDVRRCAARSLGEAGASLAVIGPADYAAVAKAVGAAGGD